MGRLSAPSRDSDSPLERALAIALPRIASALGAVTVHDMLLPLVRSRSGSGRRQLGALRQSAPGQTQGHGALGTAVALAPPVGVME